MCGDMIFVVFVTKVHGMLYSDTASQSYMAGIVMSLHSVLSL